MPHLVFGRRHSGLLLKHAFLLLLFLLFRLLLSCPVQEASRLPQPRQHGAANGVGVLPSGVLSSKQQAGAHLQREGGGEGMRLGQRDAG